MTKAPIKPKPDGDKTDVQQGSRQAGAVVAAQPPAIRAVLVRAHVRQCRLADAGGRGRLAGLRADRQRARSRSGRAGAIRPAFLLALVAGAVADRYDRGKIVRLCQIIEGLRRRRCWRSARCRAGSRARSSWLWCSCWARRARSRRRPCRRCCRGSCRCRSCRARSRARPPRNQTATIAGPAIGGLIYVVSPTLVYAICCVLFLGRQRADLHDPGRARGAQTREDRPQRMFAGIAYHPQKADHPRRDLARHVRGAARRRHGSVADLRQGHSDDRTMGARPVARVAGRRRAADGGRAGALAAAAACRPQDVRGGRGIRRGDHRVRALDLACALDRASCSSPAPPTW